MMTRSRKLRFQVPILTSLFGLLVILATCNLRAAPPLPRTAPPFTHPGSDEWLNSRPLSIEELRGKVLLIDFWTFDCWNCYRSFPWLLSLEEKLKDRPFVVVGVHTPEFEHEHDKARLAQKIEAFGIGHPVMIDNDFSYWNAMGTRYWPTYFLIDKMGVVRSIFIGETRLGSLQAKRIEQTLESLLAE